MPTTMKAPMPRKSTTRSAPEGPVVQQQDEPNLFHSGQGIDIDPSEKLMKLCGGCRLSFNWFGAKSKQVDKETKLAMAEAAETGEDGFSASKKLIDSKHPTIKEANELKRRIESTWRSMTLPLAAAAAGSTKGDAARIEGGTRLVRREDINEFDRRMKAFEPEAAAMEKKVNVALPDIKAMAEKRLQGLYNPKDYPNSVVLTYNWGYPAIAIPGYLKQLSPEIYEREVAGVQARFEQSFELAYADMLGQFQATIAGWIDRLGPVVRIYPEEGHKLRHMHGAEVLEQTSHLRDPENVPDGKVRVVVRYKPAGKNEQEEHDLGLISSHEFADLRPSEIATERKIFKDSTIEGLVEMLARFRRLGTTISASPRLTGVVQAIETQIAKCRDAGDVSKELRNSNTFRTDTHQLMQRLNEQLAAEVTTFKTNKRRVDRGAAANLRTDE